MSPFPLPIFYPFPDELPSASEHSSRRMIILMICPEQSLDRSHPLANMIHATANATDDNPTLKLTINLFGHTQLKSQKGE